MKLLISYLSEKRLLFIFFFGIFFICGLSFLLYHLPLAAVLYPAALCLVLGGILFLYDFYQYIVKKQALTHLLQIPGTLITSLPEPTVTLEAEYQALVQKIKEELTETKTISSKRYMESIEYYTMWTHQIKTPISAMRLTLQNHDIAIARQLLLELSYIEQYVEMALIYLRLDSESTDYVIREYDLDSIIRTTVKRFAGEFIDRKLRLSYNPVSYIVLTDEKWLSFVIGQVISNALKYTPSGSITITQNGTVLMITDTGIGIANDDLPRVFERGYTGHNGRILYGEHASGIGLYLCSRVCQNLGHRISITSKIDMGTTVSIDLKQSSLSVE